MRKTILALMAVAVVGLGSATGASARGGGVGVGGFGAGGGYPASFGGNYEEGGNCRLVAHRVMTHHGWRIRRVQVCG